MAEEADVALSTWIIVVILLLPGSHATDIGKYTIDRCYSMGSRTRQMAGV